MDLTAVGKELEKRADEIVGAARELSESEPYASLAEELRLDHLVPLLRTMVSAAFGGGGPGKEMAVAAAAEEHGRQRAEQGFSETEILFEYQILRAAVARFLGESWRDAEERWQVLVRIDGQITDAILASLLGMHGRPTDPERLRGLRRAATPPSAPEPARPASPVETERESPRAQ